MARTTESTKRSPSSGSESENLSEAAQKMRSDDPRERSEGARELGRHSHDNDPAGGAPRRETSEAAQKMRSSDPEERSEGAKEMAEATHGGHRSASGSSNRASGGSKSSS